MYRGRPFLFYQRQRHYRLPLLKGGAECFREKTHREYPDVAPQPLQMATGLNCEELKQFTVNGKDDTIKQISANDNMLILPGIYGIQSIF